MRRGVAQSPPATPKPLQTTKMAGTESRSSSREVGIRVPTFFCSLFSRGTLPQKRNSKRARPRNRPSLKQNLGQRSHPSALRPAIQRPQAVFPAQIAQPTALACFLIGWKKSQLLSVHSLFPRAQPEAQVDTCFEKDD